jgi:heat shock factor-binding protein 1
MDDIFNQMEKKFTNIAHQVLSKIVEMGVWINELESSIDNLMNQADIGPK